MTTTAGIVLAGGRSRRMGGRDKAFAVLGGESLVARAVRRLGPQVAALAVSANAPAGALAGLGVPILPDAVAGFPGPLAGMLAGMTWAAAAGHGQVVTAAVDTPFFPEDLVARLAAAQAGRAVVAVARSRGRIHPVFALLPVRFAADLAGVLRDGRSLRARDWIERQGAVAVDFADAGGADPFFNVNDPGDLAAASAWMGCATG